MKSDYEQGYDAAAAKYAAEVVRLTARITELTELANAAYDPYRRDVNRLQNLVNLKDDALASYAEFYGRAAGMCGLPDDALPGAETDTIILQRLAEHDEIAALRAALQAANEDAERLIRNSYEFDTRDRGFNCVYCGGSARALSEIKHSADCPITLHRARVGGGE